MINLNSFRITPLFCTAFAAAIGFYVLSLTHLALIITVVLLCLFTLSLFRVLALLDNLIEASLLRKFKITSSCCAAFAAGLVLGLCASLAGQNNVRFGIPENYITGIEGILLEDPRVITSGSVMASVQLRRTAGNFGSSENLFASASGEITLFFPQEATQKLRGFGRGTQIFAEGNLRANERGWSLSANSLYITNLAPPIERMRTGIRLNLLERFDGHQWGGLALALLVGIRDNLDNNLTTLYRDAGLSYILALSGMHLAIIAAIIAFLLKKPLGLKAASICGAVIISVYCLFVGPFPSLVRSAFMYLLGVFAILGALPKNSISILSLSFIIQIIITPAAGTSLSFILSYLALLGILITSRQIALLLIGKIPDFILNPLSLSCGAFLATAGVCIFAFGRIAPVGILAGLLIVPLTTVFMIGSIIWLALDFLSLSFLMNLPLIWTYRLMEIIASIAGRVPGIIANPQLVHWVSIVMLTAIGILAYRRKNVSLRLKPFEA